jgi:hypothetical protein
MAAIGNICSETLTMPSEFKAQNGATLDQDTHVNVTGCPKPKGGRALNQKLAKALKACRREHGRLVAHAIRRRGVSMAVFVRG